MLIPQSGERLRCKSQAHKKELKSELARIKTVEDALKFALRFEKDSVILYLGISPPPIQFAFDMKDNMSLPGNLHTTAMAVMPHRDVDRALRAAMSFDIPFWPQLPLLSYYEDMYVQAAEHFPGILVNFDKRAIQFSMEKFIAELEETLAHFEEPEFFDISETYSSVYHRFLKMDLSSRPAIRGQLEGPISFG